MRIFRNTITREIVELNDDDEKVEKLEKNHEWKELIQI